MTDLDHVAHRLFDDLERAAQRIREHFNDHPLWETIMSALDDLIAAGQALKSERAALLTDRDAQKARADKAEADRDALQAQIDADEQKAEAAADDLDAEVAAETAAVTVASPTTAGTTTIPVSQTDATAASTMLGNAITAGSTVAVSGPGIASGSTVEGVDSSSLTISQPTTADHTGDGTETLTVAPVAQ